MASVIDQKYPPLILTYQQLHAVLYPLTMGYKWGENTIHDLWKIGAPTPDSTIHNEKRIVFPSQLMKWLTDVLEKRGEPLDTGARTLVDLMTRKQPC